MINVDQVRIYRHKKCDETKKGTGSSKNGSLRDESSGFDRVQLRSNESRDERKTQQGGPIRSRNGRGRNDSPYIEERKSSSNKNARRGSDQQRQDQERRGACTKKSGHACSRPRMPRAHQAGLSRRSLAGVFFESVRSHGLGLALLTNGGE
ncbi:hypothetical protein TNCV_5083971 [Trichonephila clavipes]|nr:hypothetical protein TNCV_5083971 [Trichonephila clavipes]